MRERISRRAIGTSEAGERAAAIGAEERHGLIDGVEVDFRHPDLPASDWWADPSWWVWGYQRCGVVFPTDAERAREDREAARQEGIEVPPAHFLGDGDKITVASVVHKIGDRRFDHPHDAQIKLAYVRLHRANGEVIDLENPIPFYGRTRILQHGTREAFDQIAQRICDRLGVDDLPRWGISSTPAGDVWEQPLDHLAGIFARDAERAFNNLLPHLPDDGAPDAKLERANLRKLINKAALAGFLLAKAEARAAEHVARGVWKNLELAQDARLRTDLIAAAQEVWGKHPTWTKNRVAEAIRGDASLRSAIRTIERVVPVTSPSHPSHPDHPRNRGSQSV